MEEINAYYALTKKAFDFLAPIYNVMTLPLVRVRNQVVDFANADKGSIVLDIATGTGQQAFAFAKRGYEVIGVDLTESMLRIAQKHNKDGSVKFEAADATQLRFQANTFDVICISFALHDMPLAIRERALYEMARVTKWNGVMVIVDYDLPENKISRGLIYRLITLYEGEYYKQFITCDLAALLRKTGFTVIEQHTILFGAGRMIKAVRSNAAME
jgi:demethylmenaquinone methyltransferase/2-methoxy-6-polyprenyl-1,4-benzoquinol methylase